VDWNGILEKWGDKLYLYAKQWVSSDAEAAEMVQEAFVRLWRQHSTRPIPVDEIAAYCFTAVRHAALDHLRSSSRRVARESKAGEWLYESGAMFENTAEKNDEQAVLEKALCLLPLEQREVLTLKIWGDLKFKEIASTLEISQNTAASRYRLALVALRKHLTGGDHE
jgi:RNA polymerase sigma-70 factor, ECF subfamily